MEPSEKLALPNAELGRVVWDLAQKQLDEKKRQAVLNQVVNVVRGLEECEDSIRHCFAVKAKLLSQKAAIEDGAFDFDRHGNIVYSDQELNRL